MLRKVKNTINNEIKTYEEHFKGLADILFDELGILVKHYKISKRQYETYIFVVNDFEIDKDNEYIKYEIVGFTTLDVLRAYIETTGCIGETVRLRENLRYVYYR